MSDDNTDQGGAADTSGSAWCHWRCRQPPCRVFGMAILWRLRDYGLAFGDFVADAEFAVRAGSTSAFCWARQAVACIIWIVVAFGGAAWPGC